MLPSPPIFFILAAISNMTNSMTTNPLRTRIQREAYSLVLKQLAGIFICAAIALLLNGKTSAYSVIAGGMAYGLPNLFFVWLVFRFTSAQQMHQFLAAFFLGETLKLIFSGILFLLIVKYLSVSLLSVLVGFVCAIVSFWIVCMVHFSKQQSTANSNWESSGGVGK